MNSSSSDSVPIQNAPRFGSYYCMFRYSSICVQKQDLSLGRLVPDSCQFVRRITGIYSNSTSCSDSVKFLIFNLGVFHLICQLFSELYFSLLQSWYYARLNLFLCNSFHFIDKMNCLKCRYCCL